MQDSQTALRRDRLLSIIYAKVLLVDGPFKRSHSSRPSVSAGLIRLEG
jgi:hypothetical protein